MTTKVKSLVDELYEVPSKAEIINGEIVRMAPAGIRPGKAGLRIAASLQDYEDETQSGYAVADNVGFLVDLPNRESFSPDAGYWVGDIAEIEGLKFVKGAPLFAVECRSENDYGKGAEKKIREKIRDYFLAGTQAVWDVDLLSDTPIKLYLASDPDNPIAFRRGELAHAEPVLPGWTFPVNNLFKRMS
ncbi:MAG TPA: Uma2 family endonuclease, partial [Blastocatellia bacterium]|nr:Uma2 family endonuclease [Blastocatellia bacterium]